MRVFVLAACAAFATAAVGGQEALAQENQVDKVYACAGVADGAARLACFDAAVASMKQAQAAGDVSVVSRAQVQQAEKDTFGLGPQAQTTAVTGVMTGVAPAAAAAAELDNVKVTIVTATKRPDGSYRFTLDNGQVWEQSDTVTLGTLPRGTIEGEIRRGAMGSFFLKAGNRSLVRVKRIK